MKTVNTLAIAAVLSSLSFASFAAVEVQSTPARSEEHTSELPSLRRNSYAVVYLKTNTAL